MGAAAATTMGKKRICYQCGSEDHRAKECPQSTCRLCGEVGHDAGGCPEKPLPPVDLGSFCADSNNVKFKYVELFAGIGGFRIGLDRLGGSCVFASEVDRFARANYEANHGDRPAGDITRISENDIPDHDMLVGGFPCQSFSFSGERKGFDDHRGVLFLEIARILEKKKPKVILLENVRGLLTHEDGKTLQVIVSHLQQNDYKISYRVLDAATIVPQERKRIYIVGRRNDLVTAAEFVFPSIPNLGRGFKDIVEKSLETSMLEKLQLSSRQELKVRLQNYTEQFPGARFLSNFELPTKTLQSSYASYMAGSQFVRVTSEDNKESDTWRRLSPREAARLQGFPESFQLCENRPYHLLGNAVVPSMICLVAAQLLPYLDSSISTVSAKEFGWKAASSLLIEACPDDRKDGLVAVLTDRS